MFIVYIDEFLDELGHTSSLIGNDVKINSFTPIYGDSQLQPPSSGYLCMTCLIPRGHCLRKHKFLDLMITNNQNILWIIPQEQQLEYMIVNSCMDL